MLQQSSAFWRLQRYFFPLLGPNPMLGALVAMAFTYMAGALVGLIILTQGVQSRLKKR